MNNIETTTMMCLMQKSVYSAYTVKIFPLKLKILTTTTTTTTFAWLAYSALPYDTMWLHNHLNEEKTHTVQTKINMFDMQCTIISSSVLF